jgi:hypothetical protein
MGERRIFDGALLRAELYGSGQAGLFVSFDHYRPDRAGFPRMAAVQTALDLGYASLVISTAANDWFLNEDLPRLRAALAPLVQDFAVVRAIGFSMGGYGALLLSDTLRLGFATLWAPQVSIRAGIAPFETRFRHEARLVNGMLDQLHLHVAQGLNGVILCDPFAHPAERKHARAVQAMSPGLQIAPLPFSGHPPTHLVMRGGHYRRILAAAIEGRLTAGMIRAAHVQERWGCEMYLRKLDAALAARDTRHFALTGS